MAAASGKDHMDTLVAGRTGIGLHQRRKLFELRNQYTLTDEAGAQIGAVEQVDQSPFTVVARVISDLDVALPITLSITDAAGAEVLRLRKPWFRYAVTASDASGAVLGKITKRIRLGKAVFSVTGPGGEPVAELRAENWRARDFRFDDANGVEVARVTKQWRGLATELFTDADSYAVTFEAGTDAPTRLLALGSALAVDLVMKQKDAG
jgi:uncharacterized protein YxjI